MKNFKLSFLMYFIFFSYSLSLSAQEEIPIIEGVPITQSIERILFVEVRGSQRIEPDTIRSYMTIKPCLLYTSPSPRDRG